MKPDLGNYDVVIFDLFHTLISLDRIPPGQSAREFLNISESDWYSALFSDTENRLRGHISTPQEVLWDIIGKLQPDVESAKLEQASQLRVTQFQQVLCRVRPHILDTVRTIKSLGKRIGVISNADRVEVSSWQDSALAEFVDHTMFSCEVGYFKPESEIYLAMLDKMDVPADRCLYVGDGGDDELAGARQVGMTSALTLEFIRHQDAGLISKRRGQADYHINSIADLVS